MVMKAQLLPVDGEMKREFAKLRDTVTELRKNIAVGEQQLSILQKRLLHTDIELAQARVSRDSYKAKYEALLAVIATESVTSGRPTDETVADKLSMP